MWFYDIIIDVLQPLWRVVCLLPRIVLFIKRHATCTNANAQMSIRKPLDAATTIRRHHRAYAYQTDHAVRRTRMWGVFFCCCIASIFFALYHELGGGETGSDFCSEQPARRCVSCLYSLPSVD